MDNKCMNCTETCPQTERIQNAALGRMYAMKELVPILKKIESGELAPVVHGRWIEKQERIRGFEDDIDIYWVCSVCGATEIGKTNYCPNCGAKMDGDNE